MKQRLSHSQVNKYNECGKAYELHYKKKWRSKEQSAALLFGTAIDKACEHYLKERNESVAFDIFNEVWTTQEINGKPTKLHNCTEIVYSNNDLDLELLDESDHDVIIKTYSIRDVYKSIDDITKGKELIGFKKLSDNDKQIFNFVNWLCMRKKGRLMLSQAFKWIDENIVELLGTQVKVDLENEESDSILGFADLVARVKGYDKPVVLDFKTSSRAYEENSVKTSPQLALYVFSLKEKYENTNTGGFVVFHKNIRKNKEKTCSVCGHDGTGGRHKKCDNIVNGVRCNGEWNEKINPSVVIQVVIDEIDEIFQTRVVENYNEVNKGIKAQIFPRNWKSCVQYNGMITCPFYNHCHHDKTDGIILPEES
jgi:hypothetical protein